MKWEDVRRLDLEISAVCNAACPQCIRHPTASNLLNPVVDNKVRWTLDDVKKYLPPSDLVNIESYLFNGNYGDFITNNEALDIIEYFSIVSPNATFHINTNGSARTTDWWRKLATIQHIKVTFAIDGLKDTHHLYRRNTDFDTILENASAFIQAGGTAEWMMTIFAHNEHQVNECNELSKSLGFAKFTPRFSYRGNVVVTEDTKPIHFIKQASSLNLPSNRAVLLGDKLKEIEKQISNGTYREKQCHNNQPLSDKNDCMSYKDRSIFIGADWFVAPCCYVGNLGLGNTSHWGHDDFIQKIKSIGMSYSDCYPGDKKVSDIVDFNWVFDRVQTNEVLSVCSKNCNNAISPIKIVSSKSIEYTKNMSRDKYNYERI